MDSWVVFFCVFIFNFLIFDAFDMCLVVVFSKTPPSQDHTVTSADARSLSAAS